MRKGGGDFPLRLSKCLRHKEKEWNSSQALRYFFEVPEITKHTRVK